MQSIPNGATIMYMNVVVPIKEARAHLSELVDEVERTHQRVMVTRNGHPAAMLVSVDEWESIEETLVTLRQEGALADINAGVVEYRRGESASLDEVLNDFTARSGRVINPHG